ncbi:MAG: periplasmic heavy metal sensor [Candidatus Korarchaeota archaeon]|nr:periplasmic heavy metal sensor [Candidatus Korarchaeota archaeon]
MKKMLVGLVIVLGIGLGGLALAHYSGHGGHWGHMRGPGYGGHMMGPGYGGDMMGPGYGDCWYGPQASQLSPEQAQKLDQLRQKQWEETKGLREELSTKYQELQSLYAQPNPDQKTIDRLQKETFDLEQRLREKHFAFHQEASKIAPQFQGRYGYGKGGYYMGHGWGRGC